MLPLLVDRHLTVPSQLRSPQAKAWVQAQAQATLLRDSRRGFLHARCLTMFWGLADDLFISVRCVRREGELVAESCAQVAGGM